MSVWVVPVTLFFLLHLTCNPSQRFQNTSIIWLPPTTSTSTFISHLDHSSNLLTGLQTSALAPRSILTKHMSGHLSLSLKTFQCLPISLRLKSKFLQCPWGPTLAFCYLLALALFTHSAAATLASVGHSRTPLPDGTCWSLSWEHSFLRYSHACSHTSSGLCPDVTFSLRTPF